MKSRLTKSLATITKQLKWPENKKVGYKSEYNSDSYFNPLLTPPPRSPSNPEDFRYPQRLGHWKPLGFDYQNPVHDKYAYHEMLGGSVFFFMLGLWMWSYAPDWKLREWARREAWLRTHKREALGLPLIDRYVVDPDRVVLPTEEELGDFPVTH